MEVRVGFLGHTKQGTANIACNIRRVVVRLLTTGGGKPRAVANEGDMPGSALFVIICMHGAILVLQSSMMVHGMPNPR